MTRTRRSARQAGTRFETLISGYLSEHIDDRIERRARNGSNDRGDIGGIRMSPALRSGRVVAECKDTATTNLGAWAREVETERNNDDAVVGVVIHKRHNNGNPGEQWVTMQVNDFVALITGSRPEEP